MAARLTINRRGGLHIRPRGPCAAVISRLAALFPPVPQGRRSRPPHLGDFKIGIFAPPQSPRDDASIVPYRGCNNAGPRSPHLAGRSLRFAGEGHGPPAGPLRRRVFPVGRPVSPCFVGRAFTPAAHWQIQKWWVCGSAGSGGMRASRPTAVRGAAAVPVGPKHKIDS